MANSSSEVTFHFSVLADQKEPVLVSLNGKAQSAHVHFSATTSQFPRFGRPEREK